MMGGELLGHGGAEAAVRLRRTVRPNRCSRCRPPECDVRAEQRPRGQCYDWTRTRLSEINGFAWPWRLLSKRLSTYLSTTADCHSPQRAAPQTPLRRGRVRPARKLTRSCVFSFDAKTRARKLIHGMRKFKSATALESRAAAPWTWPNMARILVAKQI